MTEKKTPIEKWIFIGNVPMLVPDHLLFREMQMRFYFSDPKPKLKMIEETETLQEIIAYKRFIDGTLATRGYVV